MCKVIISPKTVSVVACSSTLPSHEYGRSVLSHSSVLRCSSLLIQQMLPVSQWPQCLYGLFCTHDFCVPCASHMGCFAQDGLGCSLYGSRVAVSSSEVCTGLILCEKDEGFNRIVFTLRCLEYGKYLSTAKFASRLCPRGKTCQTPP